MANPTWFNKEQYLTSKLQQLRASGDSSYSGIAAVDLAIANAGMSAYQHFVAHSKFEGTSPNQYFNVKEYLAAKADQMNKLLGSAVWTSDTVAIAIREANMSAWDHFQAHGWVEGVNPSNSFDVNKYFESKLAQLQRTEPSKGWTLDQVKAAFQAAGVDPISHSIAHGVAEGVAVTQVAEADRVPSDATGDPTFTLTTGVDTFTPDAALAANRTTSSNDTINGVQGTATTGTFTALDTIDGGAGIDTLNLQILNDATAPAGVVVRSIENLVVRADKSTGDVNTTTWAGLEKASVTQAVNAQVTAAVTTAVEVSGATGNITIDGGKDIVVTAATAGQAITIGKTTVNAGNITVTDTNVGIGAIAIDGGKDVTVSVTGSAATDDIKIGQGGAATDLASGAVKVTSSTAADLNADITQHAITINGGSSIEVNQVASSTKVATNVDAAITATLGEVKVTAGNTTSSVTVNQSASTEGVKAVTAIAGVTETASVKFTALTKDATLVIDADGSGTVSAGDLTFKAAKDLTAAEVAQAFANLTNPDTQGSGIVANGVYTLTGGLDKFLTAWTSGVASGDTVSFTSTTANSDVPNLAFIGTAPTVNVTAGSAATAAKNGVLGVVTGAVTIDDNATPSITTVTLNGYGATKIGDTATLSKLQTLNLANSGGATAGLQDAAVAVDAATVATLALNLNNVQGAVNLDKAGDNALKTLNVTATGANSTFALTAAAVETLTVAGDKAVSFTADLAVLKAVTVSGSAGLTLDAAAADTITSVNTSATSGAVTASIDGTKATYTGGAGKDVVTLATGTALTKAINLGAGDDTLEFGVAVTGSTAALNGGDGIDTLSMTTKNAEDLSGAKQTFYTGFERLTINNSAATATVDLAQLGFTNYVTTSGSAGTLTLSNLANNGTVVLTAAATTGVTVGIKDADTGTADVLNVVLSSAGTLDAGLLTAANVETINISTVDIDATKHADSLTLTADKATTVNVSGAVDLTLDLAGSLKVTSIDASTATGALNVTSLNKTAATTIKGGSGNDMLAAAAGTTADVLLGGAGNDTLTANGGMTTLTGGAGNDWFVIGTASANVNSYATITDFGAGDVLQLVGADTFASAKVTLGDTAVFQDYANAAMLALDTTGGVDAAGWFQFGGNTYAVVDISGTESTAFVNGEDFIVKLTGLVDLSQASFNATTGTIALV